MRRPLSSEITFIWKVIFPAVWIGGFAVGTILMLGYLALDGGNGKGPPAEMIWGMPLILLVGSFFLYFWCMRLKSVSMDDEALYVSNYLKEVRIPLSEVQKVEQDSIPNTHPITVTFARPTAFGKTIVFMGRMGLFDWKDIDPVEMIREAAASARSAASTQSVVWPDAGSSDAIATAPGASAHVAPRTEVTSQGPGGIRKEENGG
jgi:hypothetical protein